MSQADFNIDNVSRSLFRTEVNQSLQALASLSAGTTEPATKYAFQWWADTTTNILKMRNASNTAWVSILNLVTGEVISGLFDDNLFTLRDNIDITKKVLFQLSALTTGQTRTYTTPDKDGTLALLSDLMPSHGLFYKTDSTIVAFSKTGNFTMQTAQDIKVEVNGSLKEIAASTSITMPASPSAGTDYAIWAKTDGTLEATSNFTSPPTANARKVGGFHYAAGGNASAQAGGNTTAQINVYSTWDLKFRPVATDPRGMALVAGGFWMDIYLTGVDAITNGSSKYNVTIGDGSSPPKVPSMFGGNGSTTYGSYTWFEACELASAFNKRLPTQREFMAAGYGTTEATPSGGTDVPTTGATGTGATSAWNVFTSKWGIIQASGCMWIWADDRAGPYAAASWNANTEGRGSEYNAPNAGLLGGPWGDGANCGSRCSGWNNAASSSDSVIGSRFACDHLQLD